MKLEVRDYVRTKKGIAKILGRVNEPDNYYFKMLITDKYLEIHDDTEYIHDLDIIKSSKNIIDLIEEGDYVNGNKVIRIETSSYPEDKNVNIIVCCGDDDYYSYYNEDIKTILTKEQYENNCYKVDDK